jgi:hypothetical protein
MSDEQSAKLELAGETELLGENLSHYHFAHQKSHMIQPGIESGQARREAGD